MMLSWPSMSSCGSKSFVKRVNVAPPSAVLLTRTKVKVFSRFLAATTATIPIKLLNTLPHRSGWSINCHVQENSSDSCGICYLHTWNKTLIKMFHCIQRNHSAPTTTKNNCLPNIGKWHELLEMLHWLLCNWSLLDNKNNNDNFFKKVITIQAP